MTTVSELKGTYALDPAHTSLAFIARHAMVTKIRGTFTRFTGEATVDGADPAASTMTVVIEVASVTTGDESRDEHLRAADFFDVEHHPQWTFVGTDFEIVDDQTVNVTGDLTVKETTRPVTIPFVFAGEAKDPFGNTRIGFEGRTEVSRKDFGLTWNAVLETGGVLVSDKITLEFDVSAIKQD